LCVIIVAACITLATVLSLSSPGGRGLPAGYSSMQELRREYASVQDELRAVRGKVDHLRHRLEREALPPDVDGVPFHEIKAEHVAGSVKVDTKEVDVKRRHDDDTIFVSIASFRDVECPLTIDSMFTKAKNPTRVFIGAIEQNEPHDVGCMPAKYADCDPNKFCPSDNIRIRKVLPKEARGPTYGRFVAMLMYRGEKYFMMIDSHNRFALHWESLYISYVVETPSKRTVLSHYPSSWLNDGKSLENFGATTVMCNAGFLDDGYVRLGGRVFIKSKRPRLQPFACAGFLFADAALLSEVPFDPHLDYLFDGEEILYSARMWTAGWDIYAPSDNLIFHYYIRKEAPRVWGVKDNNWYPTQRESVARVQHVLGATKTNTTTLIVDPAKIPAGSRITRELDRYGLGKVRTLQEYWKFARLDTVHRVASLSFCNEVR
jgi:UDP-GlcNAc:polypeptide alpha-N-acetylglucosaminyltransferase